MAIRYFGTEDIDWFYKTDKQWVDDWVDSASREEIPNEDYFDYGDNQDPASIRSADMRNLLKISEARDGYEYLLNPAAQTEDGEWEAWAFGTKLPGAFRYQSFEKMMQAEQSQALLEIKPASKMDLFKSEVNTHGAIVFVLFLPVIILQTLIALPFRLGAWIYSRLKSSRKDLN